MAMNTFYDFMLIRLVKFPLTLCRVNNVFLCEFNIYCFLSVIDQREYKTMVTSTTLNTMIPRTLCRLT